MLYTRKGDNGTTKAFNTASGQRLSKGSILFEALGTVDEVNSFLGICKIASEKDFSDLAVLVNNVQQNLFIIQAELAGADKHISAEKVVELETIIDGVEKELPPIKTFFVSGGTSLAAHFDFTRTLVRRAERRVVAVHEEGAVKVGEQTLAYLNRLSSLFYACARLVNHKSGIKESAPEYK